MDHSARLIGLLLVVAATIFRLVRYVRMSGAERPLPAIPPSGGSPGPPRSDPAAATIGAATASPIEPADAGRPGLVRNLVAAAVFIPGTVVIWSLLFWLPVMADVPPFVRLTAGVLATLVLLQVARGVAARIGGIGQRGDIQDNNPIK